MENQSEKSNRKKLTLAGLPVSIFAVIFVVAMMPTMDASVSPTSSAFHFGGDFTFTHFDANGNVIETWSEPNEVTNEGMECVSDFVFATTECVGELDFAWIGLGTGVVAVDETDTALGTEVGGCTRLEDAPPAINTAVTNQRTVTVSSTFSGASCEGSAFGEVGLFDAVTTGNMLARALISPTITLASGETLQIDYDIVFNNS